MKENKQMLYLQQLDKNGKGKNCKRTSFPTELEPEIVECTEVAMPLEFPRSQPLTRRTIFLWEDLSAS